MSLSLRPFAWTAMMALTGFLLALPSGALAQPRPDQPIDPYAAPMTAQPIDPYAPGTAQPPPPPLPPPPLPVAPPQVSAPLPPLPPPSVDPTLPGTIDPYPPAPAWNGGGCPAGCPQAQPAVVPPPAARYAPYAPLAPTQVEKRPRYGVMAAGISILGGLWIISTSAGVLSGQHELIVPVVGPFLAAHELSDNYRPSAGLTMVTGMLVMDGLFQTAGLIMAIVGGSTRVAVQKRRPYGPPPTTIAPYGTGVGVRF